MIRADQAPVLRKVVTRAAFLAAPEVAAHFDRFAHLTPRGFQILPGNYPALRESLVATLVENSPAAVKAYVAAVFDALDRHAVEGPRMWATLATLAAPYSAKVREASQ